MKLRTTTYFLIILVLLGNNLFAQLTINAANTGLQVVTNSLLGPGVYAKNITFTGNNTAKGTFTCGGACNIGLPNGVILSSGSVFNAIGPNNNGGRSTAFGTAGDPTLNLVSGPGFPTLDAAVLEFDFCVATDSVEFRFVFASEEYNEFVGGFNDVFGFFLTGPGITGVKNIAVLPNGITPVTINNVNNGTNGTGPCTNCIFYNNNPVSVSIQFDGFTTVLTARAKVQPCSIYHIKLGVADVVDEVFDSGVFLEANSFQAIGQIPLTVNGQEISNFDTLTLCNGDSIEVCFPVSNNQNWSTGDTTQCIWITEPGAYYGSATNFDSTGLAICFSFTTNLIVIGYDSAKITPSGPLTFCSGDSVVLTASQGISYLWNTGDTTQSIIVKNAGNFYALVNFDSTCSDTTDTLAVQIINGTVSNIISNGSLSFCDGDSIILSTSAVSGIQWSTGETTSTITVKQSGNYSLTLTNGFCAATDSITVNVYNLPNPTISGPSSNCDNIVSTFSVDAYSFYLWSNGGTSQTINVNSTNNYSIIVTDINGCTNTTSFAYVSLPSPVPNISGNLVYCDNLSTTLTLDNSSTYNTYSWSNGALTPNVSINTPGSISVDVTASNGCKGYDTVVVVSLIVPVAVINGNLSFCSGDSITLTAGVSNFYLWSNGDTTSSTIISNPGLVDLSVTNSFGCTTSTSVNISQNSLPSLTFIAADTICSNDSTIFTLNTNASSYLWTNSGSTNSQITVRDSGWYKVIVTSADGCITTDSTFLTVLPSPVNSILSPIGFCTNDTISINSANNFSSYLWSDGSTNNATQVYIGGNYTLTVTDIYGCSSDTNISITEFTLPVPVLPAVVLNVCSGSSISLSPGIFNSYLWSDGSTNSTLNASQNGFYQVTVTDINNCSASAGVAVNVLNNPLPVIDGPTEFCEQSTFDLEVVDNYQTYLWNNGVNTKTQILNQPGIYVVEVTDLFGCKGIDSIEVLMNNLPIVDITGKPGVCEGDSTTITAVTGQGTYSWNTGATTESIIVSDDGIYTLTVITPDGCSKSNNYQFLNYPKPVISYTTQQSISCKEIEIDFLNTSIYENGSTLIWYFGDGDSLVAEQASHNYSKPGNFITYLAITSPYGCFAIDSQVVSVTVAPLPLADFNVNYKVASIFNAEIKFNNKSQYADRYLWSFGDGLASELESPSHIYEKVGEKKVVLYAFNEGNCVDEEELTINIVPYFIPNAFSPDGDGKNDVFFDGAAVMNIQNFRMEIYSRWGQNIYSSSSYLQPWDGRLNNGEDAPIGVYTYFIEVTTIGGIAYPFRGTISLVR